MNRESTGSLLSTVFVDYDNIYLSLKRKSEDAAKRFAKNAGAWIKEIESGRLITATNGAGVTTPRRIVMNRCYGNPVPRRNSKDNATDMNSFPFVRHHFLRSGFEIIDCPPLTAQLKNSADIRMVMDVRDYLMHDTYFDEFIILSGDADFTPVLHRLRAHARRTVIYANDYTAAPYTAISDGEVRESDLIALLTEGRLPGEGEDAAQQDSKGLPNLAKLADTRNEIMGEVQEAVRNAPQPVPLEALADRAVRLLGHDKTVGSAWGGAGSFRDLLANNLPEDLKLSGDAPYYVQDMSRQITSETPARVAVTASSESHERTPVSSSQLSDAAALADSPAPQAPAPAFQHPAAAIQPAPIQPERPVLTAEQQPPQNPATPPASAPVQISTQPVAPIAGLAPTAPMAPAIAESQPSPVAAQPQALAPTAPAPGAAPQVAGAYPPAMQPRMQPAAGTPALTGGAPAIDQRSAAAAVQQRPAPVAAAPAQVPTQPPPQPSGQNDGATAIQQSIARIHEACQAPPLSPPEYRVVFDVMAQELTANGLTGASTLVNIAQRAADMGVELQRDDARFILEVVSEADPWFEKGASANLFASRFRNFVVARCKSQGLNLSADQLDLIEAWFSGSTPRAGTTPQQRSPAPQPAPAAAPAAAAPMAQQAPVQQAPAPSPGHEAQGGNYRLDGPAADMGSEDFPRIIRKGLRH